MSSPVSSALTFRCAGRSRTCTRRSSTPRKHAPRVARLTTLAGWVHHQLTGRHVLGVGDASGMFPIDSEAGTYVESYLDQYEALVAERVPWRLRDVLPTVLSAGEDAGC